MNSQSPRKVKKPPMKIYHVTGNVAGKTADGTTRDVPIVRMDQIARSQSKAVAQAKDWAEAQYDLTDTWWVVEPVVTEGEGVPG